MKKLVAFLLVLSPLALLAQVPRSYITLSLGRSAPLGAYAEAKEFVQSGFARPGAVLSIDAGIYRKKNLGYAIVMSGANHPLDHARFQQQLQKHPTAGLKPILYSPNEENAWMSSVLMAGPMYGSIFGDWTLEGRILGGFYFGKNPDLDFADEGNLDDAFWKFNNNAMECYGTLGYMLSGSARYAITKHLTFRTGLNLYGGKSTFPMKIESDYKFGTQAEREVNFTQGATVFDFSLGLGYQF